MIKSHMDLTVDMIESSIKEYAEPTPSIYEATYQWINNNAVWQQFNANWSGKLALVFSWMPKIVRKDCDFPTCLEGESFEDCMQRYCRAQVLSRGFHLDRDVRLVDPADQATWIPWPLPMTSCSESSSRSRPARFCTSAFLRFA